MYSRYNLFIYYAAVIIVGNEILPTDQLEMMIATLLLFVSTIFIGVVIGEFASLLSAITKKERLKSEEVDIISTVMLNLQIKEGVQDRVFDFYNEMSEARFIKTPHLYELINPNLTHHLKMYQINTCIREISFLSFKNLNEIEAFSRELEIVFFLSGDIILKQGFSNEYLYIVDKGLVEVILEHNDFEYFDHK